MLEINIARGLGNNLQQIPNNPEFISDCLNYIPTYNGLKKLDNTQYDNNIINVIKRDKYTIKHVYSAPNYQITADDVNYYNIDSSNVFIGQSGGIVPYISSTPQVALLFYYNYIRGLNTDHYISKGINEINSRIILTDYNSKKIFYSPVGNENLHSYSYNPYNYLLNAYQLPTGGEISDFRIQQFNYLLNLTDKLLLHIGLVSRKGLLIFPFTNIFDMKFLDEGIQATGNLYNKLGVIIKMNNAYIIDEDTLEKRDIDLIPTQTINFCGYGLTSNSIILRDTNFSYYVLFNGLNVLSSTKIEKCNGMFEEKLIGTSKTGNLENYIETNWITTEDKSTHSIKLIGKLNENTTVKVITRDGNGTIIETNTTKKDDTFYSFCPSYRVKYKISNVDLLDKITVDFTDTYKLKKWS